MGERGLDGPPWPSVAWWVLKRSNASVSDDRSMEEQTSAATLAQALSGTDFNSLALNCKYQHRKLESWRADSKYIDSQQHPFFAAVSAFKIFSLGALLTVFLFLIWPAREINACRGPNAILRAIQADSAWSERSQITCSTLLLSFADVS